MNGLSCQTTTRGRREGGRKGEIQIGVDCLDRQTESPSGLDDSAPMEQDSGDSDGNRIVQDQKQKLLQDCGAPAPAFYWELPWKKELLLKKVLLLNPDLLFQ